MFCPCTYQHTVIISGAARTRSALPLGSSKNMEACMDIWWSESRLLKSTFVKYGAKYTKPGGFLSTFAK